MILGIRIMNFNFDADEDTLLLLDISKDFLVRYFNHAEDEAVELINRFYNDNKHRVTDDFYHHESSFRIAAMIHYFAFLKMGEPGFTKWLMENNFWTTPREALEHFDKRFFKHDDNQGESWLPGRTNS